MPEPEDAEHFKARIQQMIDRYEAQHLPRGQRKVSPEDIRDMEEGAERPHCWATRRIVYATLTMQHHARLLRVNQGILKPHSVAVFAAQATCRMPTCRCAWTTSGRCGRRPTYRLTSTSSGASPNGSCTCCAGEIPYILLFAAFASN